MLDSNVFVIILKKDLKQNLNLNLKMPRSRIRRYKIKIKKKGRRRGRRKGTLRQKMSRIKNNRLLLNRFG